MKEKYSNILIVSFSISYILLKRKKRVQLFLVASPCSVPSPPGNSKLFGYLFSLGIGEKGKGADSI